MIINIAAYKFVDLEALPELKQALKARCEELHLKGTILIGREGINLFVAGVSEAIDSFKKTLCAHAAFSDIIFKESLSDYQPFKRMLVKIKKEIIPFGMPEISPAKNPAPRLSPQELKSWYEQGKEMVILDTRNSFEAKVGTFKQAMHLDIRSFRDFPQAAKKLDQAFKNKPVVTFCTGGIRCEKAAPLLQQMGFKEVYQLDGGILKYFEECGSAFFEGECFVFDQRVALDSDLAEVKNS
jgi:predicted sulfurtransferase